MFPNMGVGGMLGQAPQGAGLLPNLSGPIMSQQQYQRMGMPMPGGLSPPGMTGMAGFGTAGPNMMHNPLSNSNIAAALSQQRG